MIKKKFEEIEIGPEEIKRKDVDVRKILIEKYRREGWEFIAQHEYMEGETVLRFKKVMGMIMPEKVVKNDLHE